MISPIITRQFHRHATEALPWGTLSNLFNFIWGETQRSLLSYPHVLGHMRGRWWDGEMREYTLSTVDDLHDPYTQQLTRLIVFSSSGGAKPEVQFTYMPATAEVQVNIRTDDDNALATISAAIQAAFPFDGPHSKLIFVLMSFNDDMAPAYEGMKKAGKACKLDVQRADEEDGDYRITDRIIQMIMKSRFLIADLTHDRPNVYYELGYARGKDKTVIIVARKGTDLHFDVKDWNCHFYDDSRTLETYLRKRLKREMGRN